MVKNVIKDVTRMSVKNAIGFFGSSWSAYWATRSEVLFFGEISKITGGRLYNQKSGATDYLTVGGVVGSYTFQCPETAEYLAADTDYFWFNLDDSIQAVAIADLIAYDFPRTPVKYGNESPFTLDAIMILKADAIFSQAELNRLYANMQLSIFWNGVSNLYGFTKENRLAEQSQWSPRSIPPTGDPSNVVATTWDYSRIDLSVTIGSLDADGVDWERSADGVTGWASIGTTVVNTKSNTGLTVRTKYYYRARTYRTFGVHTFYSAYTDVIFKWTAVVRNNHEWANPDVNGMPQYWNYLGTYTAIGSIVTGNGFPDKALRVLDNNATNIAALRCENSTYGPLVVGQTYEFSFRHRNSIVLGLYKNSGAAYASYAANTGNAILRSGTFIATETYWYIGSLYTDGCWIEIADLVIARISE